MQARLVSLGKLVSLFFRCLRSISNWGMDFLLKIYVMSLETLDGSCPFCPNIVNPCYNACESESPGQEDRQEEDNMFINL